MSTTAEKIAVMQAFELGKDIETRDIGPNGEPRSNYTWTVLRKSLGDVPCWDWRFSDYRIKPEPQELWLIQCHRASSFVLPLYQQVREGSDGAKLFREAI